MGTCLIGVNFPRVEEMYSLGPQEVLDQPLATVTVPRGAVAQRPGSC